MASKRQYLSQSELAEYADITITDSSEADDRITQAEELIDSYVGYQCKAVEEVIEGRVASATTTTFTLEASRHQNAYQGNFFLYCEVEIMGGTGSGQRRTITASTYAGVLTVDSSWSTTPNSTSYYRIYQLGKFPREKESFFDGNVSPQVYVKSIPEAIRRATAAQVQFMITMGDNFFAGNSSTFDSERIGNYEYGRGGGGGSGDIAPLIAPKAKMLLRGYVNRKGVMVTET
jgi:hypothetical protein